VTPLSGSQNRLNSIEKNIESLGANHGNGVLGRKCLGGQRNPLISTRVIHSQSDQSRQQNEEKNP
jgi:hypothetical protein